MTRTSLRVDQSLVFSVLCFVDHCLSVYEMKFKQRWSTIPPISTKIISHLNSLSDGQQWGDVCWYLWNCWPSLNELRWEVIFVDIGRIVDHHSMSWGERWLLLILDHLSPQLIEWWSTISPISTNITSHFNSLSDGQQFHYQYQ
jgi:hypothetical protein